MIGFSEDDYTGDEGEPGDVSRPNTPCTVSVQIIERSLEIPLQIRLTTGEGNATSKKVEFSICMSQQSNDIPTYGVLPYTMLGTKY